MAPDVALESLVSSAEKEMKLDAMSMSISLRIRNNSGAITDPCGTPDFIWRRFREETIYHISLCTIDDK